MDVKQLVSESAVAATTERGRARNNPLNNLASGFSGKFETPLGSRNL